jgi:hypothetical protein
VTRLPDSGQGSPPNTTDALTAETLTHESVRDNVPNPTPDTLQRPRIPSQERRQLMLDAMAATRAGLWLFNEEARALVETHERRLRGVLDLLEVGEVDDAIALIERLLASPVDSAQTQIEAAP